MRGLEEGRKKKKNTFVTRFKTGNGEIVTLYPPRLHSFDQILNYMSTICKATEKGHLDEARANAIKELLNLALKVVKAKETFAAYEKIIKQKEWEEFDLFKEARDAE